MNPWVLRTTALVGFQWSWGFIFRKTFRSDPALHPLRTEHTTFCWSQFIPYLCIVCFSRDFPVWWFAISDTVKTVQRNAVEIPRLPSFIFRYVCLFSDLIKCNIRGKLICCVLFRIHKVLPPHDSEKSAESWSTRDCRVLHLSLRRSLRIMLFMFSMRIAIFIA